MEMGPGKDIIQVKNDHLNSQMEHQSKIVHIGVLRIDSFVCVFDDVRNLTRRVII